MIELYNQAHAVLMFMRHYRLGPFSFIDTAGAFLAVYLLAPYLSRFCEKFLGIRIRRSAFLWLTVPVALIVHFMLRIPSPYLLMVLTPQDNFLPKSALIVMIIMGFRGIHLVPKKEIVSV